ncbi:MAG TPA: hypothetical protein VG184_12320 [Acidimicrobiales bacterium]|nr:hypothetical protein [Acidimicrobiales bacterium]
MSYLLQFTEKMYGAFAFGETDYRAGYTAGLAGAGLAGGGLAGGGLAGGGGLASGGEVMFRLTIAADDVSSMIADPNHKAVPRGYVGCEALGGRLPVEAGVFDLFVDEGPSGPQSGGQGGGTRHMLYRLYFSDSTGRPLTLAGYKDVRPGPLLRVWPETSTLYTRILAGHVPVDDGGQASTDGVVGSGILRIRPLDFAWQLTTFRVRGPSRLGELRAFDAFGRLFLGELWQVFDPLRRHPGAGKPAAGKPAAGKPAAGKGPGEGG